MKKKIKSKNNSDMINNSEFTLLIVDDDFAVRDSLSEYMQSIGCRTLTAETAEIAMQFVENGKGDIVITDVCMPGMNGIDLTVKLKEIDPDIEVLIATGHSDEQLAIDALKAGAFDYFRKPINVVEVAASVKRTQRFRDISRENSRLKAIVACITKIDSRHYFVGESAAYKAIAKQIEKVSRIPNTTILLTGESGVGKEVIARMIHKFSNSPSSPFIAINCGGIPETLLESELFGREKGAYTGADKMTPGVFEMAIGGTVLLDEISEMSVHAQSRFLRVIEERCLRRLGGTKELSIDDVRIVATTNRNLEQMVSDGEFREDLYHRITVAPILVPPLRERPQDILPLARFFLDQIIQKFDHKFILSKQVEQILISYHFPGNIRELRNIIERATIFADPPEIKPEDLGLKIIEHSVTEEDKNQSANSIPANQVLNLKENEMILVRKAQLLYPSNHSAAARSLGISTQSLYRKLEKYGLTLD